MIQHLANKIIASEKIKGTTITATVQQMGVYTRLWLTATVEYYGFHPQEKTFYTDLMPDMDSEHYEAAIYAKIDEIEAFKKEVFSECEIIEKQYN